MKIKLLLSFILFAVCANAQNVGINTTGAAPATTNLFEVLQPSTTNNTKGIYTLHSGAVGAGNTGYSLWAEKTGATGNNVAGYFATSGAATSNTAGYFTATGATNNYGLLVPSGGGKIGFGTVTPRAATLVDIIGTTTTNSDAVLTVDATGTSGSVNAIYSTSASTSGTALYGKTTAASGSNNGVIGEITDGTGNGVKGIAGAAADANSTGVWGINNSTTTGAIEVFGVLGSCKGAGATSATHYGLFGDAVGGSYNRGIYAKATGAASNNNYGGYFFASGATSYNAGVRSETSEIDGDGVFGYNTAAANTGLGSGVYGSSNQSFGAGVWGDGGTNSAGVFGTSAKSHVWNSGVYGENDNNTSGSSWTYTQVTCGVSGRVTGTAVYATGVYGYNNNSTVDNNAAVFGQDGQGAFGGIAMTFTPSATQRTMSLYGRGAGVTIDDRSIQGEWSSAAASPFGVLGLQYDGVWGINNGTTAGTAYNDGNAGVYGSIGGSGSYRFGVEGYNGTVSNRSGGALGSLSSSVWASSGYQSSGGSYYGLYSSATLYNGTTNTNGGRLNNDYTYTEIGIGSYGSIVGSWSRGEIFGNINYGEKLSSLNLNHQITFGSNIEMIEVEEKITPVYSNTNINGPTLTYHGRGKTTNGEVYIRYSKELLELISVNEEPIVIITPKGDCNGFYIKEFDKGGFYLKEMRGGESTVEFNYQITAQRKDSEKVKNIVFADLKKPTIKENLRAFMFNESNTQETALPMIWKNGKLIFGETPSISKETLKEKEQILKKNVK